MREASLMTIPTPIVAFTQREEGGYTNDPRDSGNWSSGVCGHGSLIGSNLGIGAPAAIAWMHPNEAVVSPAWMRDSAATIWLPLATARYWRPLSCDALPPALGEMQFDYGWNRGIANAARQLQEVLGIAQDGDAGPVTVAAALAVALPSLLTNLADVQEAHYRGLRNFEIYGKDWLARTERRLQAARGLAGISAPVSVLSAPVGKPVPVASPLVSHETTNSETQTGLSHMDDSQTDDLNDASLRAAQGGV